MATSGAACDGSTKYAQDGTYVLKCENGAWAPGITVAAGDQLLAAYKAKLAPRPPTTQPRSQSSYYANCTAARAAGVTPIYRGEPGYSSKLDRDGDGVACE